MTNDQDDGPSGLPTPHQAREVTDERGTALARLAEATGTTVIIGEYRGWTNRLKIAGTSGLEYTVSMRVSDSAWGCSCPGWIFHRHCHHLDAMLPSLLEAFPGSIESPPLQRLERASATLTNGRALSAAPTAPRLTGPSDGSETRAQYLARVMAEAVAKRAALGLRHPGDPTADDVPPGQPVVISMTTSPRARSAEEPTSGRRRSGLSVEEVDARKKERIRKIVTGEIYRRVAPGSSEVWATAAAAFARGDATFIHEARAYQPEPFKARKLQPSPALTALFLEELPADLVTLYQAYRRAVMRVFREAEFNDTSPAFVAGFARITAAYEALKKLKEMT